MTGFMTVVLHISSMKKIFRIKSHVYKSILREIYKEIT
nr:MAG TPA: hypothetical protein [Caudoviricetes sp.]